MVSRQLVRALALPHLKLSPDTGPPPAPSPRMQEKARHLIAVSTRCLISVANRFPAEVLQYYSYLPLAPGAPPGKAGAREGSEVPGLIQSGNTPELHDGRWVTLPRFCSPLNGAGSRAGRVRSPANIHLWHGKAANRGAISLPGSEGQRLRKPGFQTSLSW